MTLIVNIKKKLSHFTLEANFEIDDYRLAVLGQSGAGKSMLLKCIAGIETPDEGYIILDGTTLFDTTKKVNCPIQQRNVGYLFQDYALFPNMTVQQNIAISLPKRENKQQIFDLLCNFGLQGYENTYPYSLSNGQKQRVALARILLSKPKIVLLDEPFSALDEHIKWKLENELLEMLKSYNKTVVFVSHNKEEVFHISERTMVLHQGKAGQAKETKVLFQNPTLYSEAILTGYKNIYRIEDAQRFFTTLCLASKKSYFVLPMEAISVSLNNEPNTLPYHCVQCLPHGNDSYLLCLQEHIDTPYIWKKYKGEKIEENTLVYVYIDNTKIFYVET